MAAGRSGHRGPTVQAAVVMEPSRDSAAVPAQLHSSTDRRAQHQPSIISSA